MQHLLNLSPVGIPFRAHIQLHEDPAVQFSGGGCRVGRKREEVACGLSSFPGAPARCSGLISTLPLAPGQPAPHMGQVKVQTAPPPVFKFPPRVGPALGPLLLPTCHWGSSHPCLPHTSCPPPRGAPSHLMNTTLTTWSPGIFRYSDSSWRGTRHHQPPDPSTHLQSCTPPHLGSPPSKAPSPHRVYHSLRHLSELLGACILQLRAIVDGASEIYQRSEINCKRELRVGGGVTMRGPAGQNGGLRQLSQWVEIGRWSLEASS